jgi:hypothetical protein
VEISPFRDGRGTKRGNDAAAKEADILRKRVHFWKEPPRRTDRSTIGRFLFPSQNAAGKRPVNWQSFPGRVGSQGTEGPEKFNGIRSRETNADRSFPEVNRAACRIVSISKVSRSKRRRVSDRTPTAKSARPSFNIPFNSPEKDLRHQAREGRHRRYRL